MPQSINIQYVRSAKLCPNTIHIKPGNTFCSVCVEIQMQGCACLIVLWHVDPLLGNDREKSNFTIYVAK
jgi:hypothetical protein